MKIAVFRKKASIVRPYIRAATQARRSACENTKSEKQNQNYWGRILAEGKKRYMKAKIKYTDEPMGRCG